MYRLIATIPGGCGHPSKVYQDKHLPLSAGQWMVKQTIGYTPRNAGGGGRMPWTQEHFYYTREDAFNAAHAMAAGQPSPA